MTTPVFAIPESTPFEDLLSLKGRRAIITGGTRGIGEAIVLRLAQAGAEVVVTARGQEALTKIEEKVSAFGGRAIGLRADASKMEDAKRVIDFTVSKLGGVDILVNNAAVFPPRLSVEMTEEIWDQTVDTDLKGPFFLSKLAALEMIQAGHGGRIINVLSTEIFKPTGFLAPYGAAKSGLMAVTQSMAVELGPHGIQVNAVIPGATMTAERIAMMQNSATKAPFSDAPTDAPLTLAKQQELLEKGGLAEHLGNMPLGRTGYPDDLAKAVLFMASDLASYVNGTSLTVDGAQTLR
ncbi:SDR family oxidoreductase [Rhizobium sp. NZLR1]|uniref:SDR family NAD(P)-dependent oxidoreductase n=1 Tax=Rhizobium sp. NZLR1 TaxID=2731096 RepID=UPI001A99C7AE|nr:SDR family oxidoreductase [Rhizobium sp. NZLR1]MBX5204686.1 SDR family oxidoreductase [Rhizobium sp. NZLR1]QSZ23397.1 SDR family oxidoreductase [Rhizobium sp. NZLR1]